MSTIEGVIKSARNVMRQDIGTASDELRILQLGWMIFLKVVCDKEQELSLLDDTYSGVVPDALQWRNWAAGREGITGSELVEFVDQTLFPELSSVQSPGNPQLAALIREVFSSGFNYMKSGVHLRQVINKLNEVDFNSRKDKQVFGQIYETFLSTLQSAGTLGEFYTPRAITRLMAQVIDPGLDELILDPSCGTGGFLVEVIEQLKSKANSVSDREKIQRNVVGWEYKPLPYLLANTNLILHDISSPRLKYGDALARPLVDYTDVDRVDVVLGNPPFGGVVSNNNERNFPQEVRTKESADLFLVMIMRLLRKGGRASLVLPDGSLSGDGVKQRIRKKFLEECDLHTIVRLPNSVFKPYATVATNLLFFEKGKSTKGVWYYEHKYPFGIKSYSKTNPIRYEEFEELLSWWDCRIESECAWYVDLEQILARDYDLDIKNPSTEVERPRFTAVEYIERLRDDLGEIDQEIDAIRQSLVGEADGEVQVLSNVCNVVKGKTGIKKAIPGPYPLVTTAEERASHNEYQIDGDAVCIPLVSSTGHGHASIKRIHYQSGKFALGTILAAVIPKDSAKLSAKYLYYYLSTFKDEAIVSLMKGMANVTLTAAKIGNIPIFVPEYQKQLELVELMERCQGLRDTLKRSNSDAEDMIKATFLNAFPDRARFEGDS